MELLLATIGYYHILIITKTIFYFSGKNLLQPSNLRQFTEKKFREIIGVVDEITKKIVPLWSANNIVLT